MFELSQKTLKLQYQLDQYVYVTRITKLQFMSALQSI